LARADCKMHAVFLSPHSSEVAIDIDMVFGTTDDSTNLGVLHVRAGNSGTAWQSCQTLDLTLDVEPQERWWEVYASTLEELRVLAANVEKRRDELHTLCLNYLLQRSTDGNDVVKADEKAEVSLSWDEVRAVGSAFFTHRGLPAPPISERTWYFLWIRHERDNRASASVSHAVDFALTLVDDIISLLEGIALPLAPEPGIYLASLANPGLTWHHQFRPYLHQIALLLKELGSSSSVVVAHIRSIFEEVDVNLKGFLTWSKSDVRRFVRASFKAHGLSAPWQCETDWHSLMVSYCKSKRECKHMHWTSCLTMHGSTIGKGTASRQECLDFAHFALRAFDVSQVDETRLNQVFSAIDSYGREELDWHRSEVSLFLRRVFGWRGFPSACVPLEWWYLQYREIDRSAAYELTFHGALQILELTLVRLLQLNSANMNGVIDVSQDVGTTSDLADMGGDVSCVVSVAPAVHGVYVAPDISDCQDLQMFPSSDAGQFLGQQELSTNDMCRCIGNDVWDGIRRHLRENYGSYENAFQSLGLFPDDDVDLEMFLHISHSCGIIRIEARRIFEVFCKKGESCSFAQVLQLSEKELMSLDWRLIGLYLAQRRVPPSIDHMIQQNLGGG